MAITEKVPQTTLNSYGVIGQRPIRPDGVEKVTGRAVYGGDVHLPNLAYGVVLRSPHAHAHIKRINISQAQALPGVLAVITAQDMPLSGDQVPGESDEVTDARYVSDKLLALRKVLYRGHPVAAVVALDLNTAQEAIKFIDVEYEKLGPVLDVEQALSSSAPILHNDLIGDHLGKKVGETNLARHFRHEFGDINRGFEDSFLVREGTYRLATVHQGYIEPQNSTALWQPDGKLTIWTSTQGPFGVRESLSAVLKIPEGRIRVIPCEIGGGFGGKLGIYLEPLAAILSKRCGRPVRMIMDRNSVFEGTGPTPGAKVTVKLGVDKSGRLLAAAADLYYEAGAYPGSPVGAGAMCIFAPYRIQNTRIDGYDVVVNKPKSSAYRAPGATQAAFAMESLVDEICAALQMDPLEFRLLNASHEGDRRADGPLFRKIGTDEVHQSARQSFHYQSSLGTPNSEHKKRGRGVATGFWFNGGMRSSVSMSIGTDGNAYVVEGSVDIGGSRASIAMQVAETLGVPFEDIHLVITDTEGVGYNDQTGGSRTTNTTGYAAYLASKDVIQKMSERAALIWNLGAETVEYRQGYFRSLADPELLLSFKQVAAQLNTTGGPLAAVGSVQQRGGAGGFGTHIVDVEVDCQTGKVDVLRYTAVQDAGKAIHPSYVEGQMQGGVAQGIGWALNEEYSMNDQGIMENPTFLDYRMPTILDLPMIETIIVEVPNPDHPFGVRGVGEVPIVAPVPAIANAIYNALGVRFFETPMKPSRVLAAINQTKDQT